MSPPSRNPSKAIQSRTGRRVFLSRGLNPYKLTVSFVFRVPSHNHGVLSPRSSPAEQINHRGWPPCGLLRPKSVTGRTPQRREGRLLWTHLVICPMTSSIGVQQQRRGARRGHPTESWKSLINQAIQNHYKRVRKRVRRMVILWMEYPAKTLQSLSVALSLQGSQHQKSKYAPIAKGLHWWQAATASTMTGLTIAKKCCCHRIVKRFVAIHLFQCFRIGSTSVCLYKSTRSVEMAMKFTGLRQILWMLQLTICFLWRCGNKVIFHNVAHTIFLVYKVFSHGYLLQATYQSCSPPPPHHPPPWTTRTMVDSLTRYLKCDISSHALCPSWGRGAEGSRKLFNTSSQYHLVQKADILYCLIITHSVIKGHF
jgi:hypothetical protein